LVTTTLDIFVVLAPYRLLGGVDRTLAAFMVVFGLCDVPIYFVNTLNDVGVINEVFWGLWLLPFGVLVYKSSFLPRFLDALSKISEPAA
jgi:hypothetical protein